MTEGPLAQSSAARAGPATLGLTARGLPPGVSATGPAPARPRGPRRGRLPVGCLPPPWDARGARAAQDSPSYRPHCERWCRAGGRPGGCPTEPDGVASWRAGRLRGPSHRGPLGQGGLDPAHPRAPPAPPGPPPRGARSHGCEGAVGLLPPPLRAHRRRTAEEPRPPCWGRPAGLVRRCRCRRAGPGELRGLRGSPRGSGAWAPSPGGPPPSRRWTSATRSRAPAVHGKRVPSGPRCPVCLATGCLAACPIARRALRRPLPPARLLLPAACPPAAVLLP